MTDNNKSTPKEVIKELYKDNSEKFVVFANVLVPVFSRSYHQLSKDGWCVVPTSGGTEYFKEFNIKDTELSTLTKSINSLNRLLLAYFAYDYAPRKIHSFDYPQLMIDKMPSLITAFGNSKENLSIEENAMLSFQNSGDLFTGMITDDPHFEIDIQQIIEWYEIFKDPYLFNSVTLIKESFILINNQFKQNYYDLMNLTMGIIMLVSALEGLFTHGSGRSDISFKFKTIGALFYEKFVTNQTFDRFIHGVNSEKFSMLQFKEILKNLYNLRSDIAHGRYQTLKTPKTWKNLFSSLNVGYEDDFDEAVLIRQAALALSLFEIQILALIIEAKGDLKQGVNIIDEVKI
jgi:hypothetical protein